MRWAGLALPSATAPESIVRRIGGYQAVPSWPWIPQPGEHVRVALQRRQGAFVVPARRVARAELAQVRLRGPQRGRRRLDVQRVAILAGVRDRDRRLEVRGQQRERLPERRRIG